jgi:hypothetical protein
MPDNKLISLIIFLWVAFCSDAFCQQKSDWQIWIVPNSYTIDRGDKLHVVFGITGYGPLDPRNVKIIAYSEENTLITYTTNSSQFNTYLVTPGEQTPKDVFTKKVDPKYIFLESDHSSPFGYMFLTPQTSGDKKLTLIATYSPDGTSWYTTSRELNYHVNSFIEKHQTFLAIAGIALAFLAIPFFNDFYNCVKKKFNKATGKRSPAKH